MSQRRIAANAGYVEVRALPKGPNGRPLCRWCRQEITDPRRRTFCGEDCVHQHTLRTNPTYVHQCVGRRDHGVCAVCGRDMDAAYREWLKLPRDVRMHATRTLFLPPKLDGRRDWWDADHIVPVVEGGGECGLDNYRTLCYRCHAAETKALAARRALRRRQQTVMQFEGV